MSIKPLHVETAEALGWTGLHTVPDGTWWGITPQGSPMQVPPYSTSWCSAGALVTRFKVGVTWDHSGWVAQHADELGYDQYADGETPTEAICRLIVHLHKKGSLKNGR